MNNYSFIKSSMSSASNYTVIDRMKPYENATIPITYVQQEVSNSFENDTFMGTLYDLEDTDAYNVGHFISPVNAIYTDAIQQEVNKSLDNESFIISLINNIYINQYHLLKDIITYSIKYNSYKTFDTIIKLNNVNINIIYYGKTLLFTFIKKNNIDAVRLLLKAGADPNLIYVIGEACNMNNIEIVKELLKYNIDINNVKYQTTLQNALHIACENENPKIVKQLLKYNVNNNNVNYKTVLQNALHIACERINIKCIKMLVEAGADISIITSYLYNLYCKIIKEKKGYGVMKMLIKSGINMNECSTFINKSSKIEYSFRPQNGFYKSRARNGTMNYYIFKKSDNICSINVKNTVYHSELLTNGKLLKYILLNGNISCDYRHRHSLIPLSPYEFIFINKVKCADSVIKKLIKYKVKCDIDIEYLINLYEIIDDNMDITNFNLIIMNNISCYKNNNMLTLINKIIYNDNLYKNIIKKIDICIDIVKLLLNNIMY
jgi:ankyrin repeat protein